MGCVSSSVAVAPSRDGGAGSVAVKSTVAVAADSLFDNIELALGDELGGIPSPWPRNQDCDSILERGEPLPEDLVVCVSHGWPYQAHPDPNGEKAAPIQQLLEEANQAHKPAGRTLVFFDFLSVTQRPRTPQEDAAFKKALQVMPELYCHADAVLHIDELGGMVGGDGGGGGGDEFEVALADLDGAQLMGLNGTVQVMSCPSEAVPALSIVRRIGDAAIATVADVAAARSTSCDAPPPRVVLGRAPFGLRNATPCSDRGWVFLERFCSMVKVAMCDDDTKAARVVFSNSEAVLREIREGGMRLRDAAKAGEDALMVVLEEFVAVLLTKRFAGASADATAGRVGHSHQEDQATKSRKHSVQLSGDALVVANLMKHLAKHLPAHWEQEKAQQRQRALVLAVNRGDPADVKVLCASGADPNVRDKRGKSCLHSAALRCDEPVCKALIEAGARTDIADDRGNLAVHVVPLWASEDTISLLSLLGRAAPLGALNKAGVNAFDRIFVWGSTAADNSEWYAPAKVLLDQWSAGDPTLLNGGVADDAEDQIDDDSQLAQVVATQVEVEFLTGSVTSVLSFAHPDAKFDIIMFCAMISLPFKVSAPYVERFCRRVAHKFTARVLVVTHHPRSFQSTLAEFHGDLLAIVDKLDLRDGKYGVISCMSSTSDGILWDLQPRLAFALIANTSGFWAKDYLDSPAHQKFSGMMDQYVLQFSAPEGQESEAWWSDGRLDKLFHMGTSINSFTRGKDEHEQMTNALIEAFRCEEDTAELVGLLRHSACMLRWNVREHTESLQDKPKLQLPVTVLMGAFTGASQHECAERFHKELLACGTLGYVPRTKGWFFVPSEQRDATRTMLQALTGLHEQAVQQK